MTHVRTRDFSGLGPEAALDAVEAALGRPVSGLIWPLPSYVNLVFELQAATGERLIAKFYRPGRWTWQGIVDEHRLINECAHAEIPVCPPLRLPNGRTVADADGIPLAIFPKIGGRVPEPVHDDDWRRLGRLVGRIHAVAAQRHAHARPRLHPQNSTQGEAQLLIQREVAPPVCRREFEDALRELVALASPLFQGARYQRLHGDFRLGNLIEHATHGLQVIDFDDMCVGPAVQDLWLLLPGYAGECEPQLNLLIEGYEDFAQFDRMQLRLIEPLRAMRLVYFLATCARQEGDPIFHERFPEWYNETFWQRQTLILQEQLTVIRQGDGGRGRVPHWGAYRADPVAAGVD